MTAAIADRLGGARRLAASGNDAAATQLYLEVLQRDPAHVPALIELGALAEASGHVSAARTAYQEAVRIAPDVALARVGLANLLRDSGALAEAALHYRAALATDPSFAMAHQGLAQTLAALDDPAASAHWRAGFAGRSVFRRRFRGVGGGISLLLLVAAKGGNVPTARWIDNRRFAVTAVCADFYDHAEPLPPHAVIVNAIGDPDLGADALASAARIVACAAVPVLNHPSRVRLTGRLDNARRLRSIPGVVAPAISKRDRAGIAAGEGLRFPLLLRTPGHHAGHHFLRVDTAAALEHSLAMLPGHELLVIEALDAFGIDGMVRKYRVMFIDGVMFPVHLAIAGDWKVHYFTAAMAERPDFRDEERRFLDAPLAVLGPRAVSALHGVCAMLQLDYCGVDFALAPDGSVLLFEANATMVLNPPEPDPIWNYRRPAIDAAIRAAITMLERRAEGMQE